MTALAQKEQSNTVSVRGPTDSADGEKASKQVVTLGLVPSPGLSERVIADLAEELPAQLSERIDDRVDWNLVIVPDPLTGSKLEAPGLLEEVYQRSQAGGWDYAICITDLPIRRNKQIVIADVSIERRLAWISMSALGVVQLRTRVQTAILQLMSQLRWGTAQVGQDHQDQPQPATTGDPGQRDRAPHQFLASRMARQVTPSDGHMDIGVRYVTPRVRGHMHLLAGMVYANRPWSLFPSFKATVATAFATGAYGLIFPTLWELGDAYSAPRLVTLTVLSMLILTTWIIVAHDLWEPHPDGGSPYLTTLYNSATALTITAAVVFAYIVVFILIFLAGSIFVPEAMLESTLQHSVSWANYLKIAWVTASVATIAGTVGAGLENSDAVRNATFGYRQRQRYQEYQNSEEAKQ